MVSNSRNKGSGGDGSLSLIHFILPYSSGKRSIFLSLTQRIIIGGLLDIFHALFVISCMIY